MENNSAMDNNSAAEGNLTSDSIFLTNCRPDWPRWTCAMATTCGLISTTIWFIVLLPQVWKNFRRKSVVGVSVLWATANFTASVTNMFFVHLYADMPIYSKINSIYMPTLELIMLLQFWIYGEFSRKRKILYTLLCCCIWAVIIGLQLGLRSFEEMQWLAITMWSIETFPQVVLNIKLRSTSGLSTKSIAIAMIGKTTDFIANNMLIMPLQYIIMIYFSSSVGYMNGIQVAWYYDFSKITRRYKKSAALKTIEKNQTSTQDRDGVKPSVNEIENNEAVDTVCKKIQIISENNEKMSNDNKDSMKKHFADNDTENTRISDPFLGDEKQHFENEADVFAEHPKLRCRYKLYKCIRLCILVVMSVNFTIFSAVLIWNLGTFLGLFGPLSIITVVVVSHVYYKTQKAFGNIKEIWMRMVH